MSTTGGVPIDQKRSRLRHKFEDVDRATTDAAEEFVRHSVISEQGASVLPHLSRAAASCTVRLPFDCLGSQSQDVVEFVGSTLLDRHALQWLEQRKAINWAPADLCGQMAPMKTDGDGNCLTHAAGLAMWGLQDSSLVLRNLIHDVLRRAEFAELLRPRWRLAREKQDAATALGLELDDSQWDDEWRRQIVDLSSARERVVGLPYASLEQFHVFVLSQILRRPIVVVANDVVEGFNGDELQRNDIAGIYLPILHRPTDCVRSPLTLAYFENHFVGLAWLVGPCSVPLCRQNGHRLPVLFLTEAEEKEMDELFDKYLDRLAVTKGGVGIEVARAKYSSVQPEVVQALAEGYAASLSNLYQEDCQARCSTPKCRSYKRQGYTVCCSCSLRMAKASSPTNATSPKRCTNNKCSFFGDPALNGLCSVCGKRQHSAGMESKSRSSPPPSVPTRAGCSTPGCPSKAIICKGFCSPCLDKMANMWLSQFRVPCPSGQRTPAAAHSKELPTPRKMLTSATASKGQPCRTKGCPFFGCPRQHNLCSSCFQLVLRRESQTLSTSKSCRQNLPQDKLMLPHGQPLLPGRV